MVIYCLSCSSLAQSGIIQALVYEPAANCVEFGVLYIPVAFLVASASGNAAKRLGTTGRVEDVPHGGKMQRLKASSYH